MLRALKTLSGGRTLAAVAFLALMGGCTTVETRTAGTPGSTGEGLAYTLPRGEFTLSVIDSNGVLNVTLGGPIMRPDESARMVTRLPRNGSSDDNVTILVDENDPLFLGKVEVTSTGRVSEIARQAARLPFTFQGAENLVGTQIFAAVFDVDDYEDAARRANAFLRDHYADRCPADLAESRRRFTRELTAAGYTPADANLSVRNRLLTCRQLAETGFDAPGGPDPISLSLDDAEPVSPGREAPTARPVRPDDSACARGICYRPLRSVRFTLSVGAIYSVSETFLLPDTSRLMFVDLRSGLFAQQRYTLQFSRGVLTSYNQNAQSEVVGFLKLPIDVLGAMLAAPGEALGLRQTALEAETNYLTAVRNNVTGQRDTATTCHTEGNAAACPGPAYRLIRVQLAPSTAPSSPTVGGNTGNANTGNGDDKVPGGGG